ncbi:DUF6950 family protein [Hoeflea sp.]|uniref:DUF6950 family protein n=1 Tax=Hoeflea sp. TaxID=1940281 RepID=UPI003BAFEF3F
MNRATVVSEIIKAARAEPYAYGINDCFFLGLKVIDALQGTSHVDAYTGSYSTLKGAQKALRKHDHTSLITFLSELGEPVAWGRSRIGDIAIVEVDGAEHVGIHGGQSWHSITEAGPAAWPLHFAKRAFRV